MIRPVIVLATLLLTTHTTLGQQGKTKAPTSNKHYVKHTFTAKDGTGIAYWLMPPAKIEKGKSYPLVLALHGRGGNTTAATVLGSADLRRQFPCFVLAPASTRAGFWARPTDAKNLKGKAMLPAALEAMDSVMQKHPIDTERVYVTGQSMGGFGSFGAIAQRPAVFAAAVPVCGGWDVKDAKKIKHIAIWVFHGDQDKTVPVERSRSMIQGLKSAGGSPKYTEYEGVGHNSWSKTYESAEMWKWLFAQKRQP